MPGSICEACISWFSGNFKKVCLPPREPRLHHRSHTKFGPEDRAARTDVSELAAGREDKSHKSAGTVHALQNRLVYATPREDMKAYNTSTTKMTTRDCLVPMPKNAGPAAPVPKLQTGIGLSKPHDRAQLHHIPKDIEIG